MNDQGKVSSNKIHNKRKNEKKFLNVTNENDKKYMKSVSRRKLKNFNDLKLLYLNIKGSIEVLSNTVFSFYEKNDLERLNGNKYVRKSSNYSFQSVAKHLQECFETTKYDEKGNDAELLSSSKRKLEESMSTDLKQIQINSTESCTKINNNSQKKLESIPVTIPKIRKPKRKLNNHNKIVNRLNSIMKHQPTKIYSCFCPTCSVDNTEPGVNNRNIESYLNGINNNNNSPQRSTKGKNNSFFDRKFLFETKNYKRNETCSTPFANKIANRSKSHWSESGTKFNNIEHTDANTIISNNSEEKFNILSTVNLEFTVTPSSEKSSEAEVNADYFPETTVIEEKEKEEENTEEEEKKEEEKLTANHIEKTDTNTNILVTENKSSSNLIKKVRKKTSSLIVSIRANSSEKKEGSEYNSKTTEKIKNISDSNLNIDLMLNLKSESTFIFFSVIFLLLAENISKIDSQQFKDDQ